MIKNLEIKNYALIQNLSIDFDRGLNIITGETGAGKSILLGALGLVMGKRADTKVLYDANSKCIVEARYDTCDSFLIELLKENDIEVEEELIIRREIAVSGKSRSFVNDTPVTLDVLQQISDELIDLHQQFDTLALQKSRFQENALDAVAETIKSSEKYKSDYLSFRNKEKELASIVKNASESSKEIDFILFQLKELNEAKLKENEQQEIELQLDKLNNAEDIKRISLKISNLLLNNENSLIDILTEMSRELSSIVKMDVQYQMLYDRINSVIEELKDVASESESIAESTEYDGRLANQIQERLNLIYKLEKKHGVNGVNDLISVRDTLSEKLKGFESFNEKINALKEEISGMQKQLTEKAQSLSQKRQKAVKNFEDKINTMLAQLSMPNAKLKIDIKKSEELTQSGIDEIQFLFATNKGSDFLPLKDVASGGEMSRLTLCLKAVIADKVNLPTMIFDEIDTGVSGEVAARMGSILKGMARQHQMISITHSPQIASKADRHYFVYKQDGKDRTISHMKILSQEERLQEIAKMLSGEKPGKAALDNAKELLNSK